MRLALSRTTYKHNGIWKVSNQWTSECYNAVSVRSCGMDWRHTISHCDCWNYFTAIHARSVFIQYKQQTIRQRNTGYTYSKEYQQPLQCPLWWRIIYCFYRQLQYLAFLSTAIVSFEFSQVDKYVTEVYVSYYTKAICWLSNGTLNTGHYTADGHQHTPKHIPLTVCNDDNDSKHRFQYGKTHTSYSGCRLEERLS